MGRVMSIGARFHPKAHKPLLDFFVSFYFCFFNHGYSE